MKKAWAQLAPNTKSIETIKTELRANELNEQAIDFIYFSSVDLMMDHQNWLIRLICVPQSERHRFHFETNQSETFKQSLVII